ncbi:NUDIX hydrolase [Enterovirga sp.]|uniref:NUDIX hydrolase n=1 Tax=Enterovirga sp. TaxID=2026350 RepID=UPI002CD686B1|nr:NUDIX hydrolase [Enterovirga sp.]HMO30420.1 NUDIX hydrolase [Enterovirga sp.]
MKITKVEALYEGWGQYLLAVVTKPDGRQIRREVESHGDAAAVLAYDPRRRTALLARQLRVPMLLAAGITETLEVAAGLIDGDEEPEACIRREAAEELGLTLRDLEPVVTMMTMPGLSTERIHLFLAAYGAEDRTGEGGGLASEEEDVTIAEMSLAELAALADRGELADAKTLVLLQTLRLRRPGLFGPAAEGASEWPHLSQNNAIK